MSVDSIVAHRSCLCLARCFLPLTSHHTGYEKEYSARISYNAIINFMIEDQDQPSQGPRANTTKQLFLPFTGDHDHVDWDLRIADTTLL